MNTMKMITLFLIVATAGLPSAVAQTPAPATIAPYFLDLMVVAKEFDDLGIERVLLSPSSSPRNLFNVTFPAEMLEVHEVNALEIDIKAAVKQDVTVHLVRFFADSNGKKLDRLVVQYTCKQTGRSWYIRMKLHGVAAQEAFAKKWAAEHKQKLEDRMNVFLNVGTGSRLPGTGSTLTPSTGFGAGP